MKELTRELGELIRRNCENDTDFLSLINIHGLEMILNEEIKDIDQNNYERARKNIYEQNERYKLFASEIEKIASLAYSHGLNLLFMKGITIANELFEPIGLRKSFDMDLFIDYTEVELMDGILFELGYFHLESEKNYTNSIQHIKKYKSIRDELTHITVYHKFVNFLGEKMRLDLDLHIHCCHYMPEIKKESSESFFSRSRWVKYPEMNLEIKVLEIHDAFIQLTAHFIRHYYWEYFRFLRGEKHFRLRIDLLFEMALFLKKNKCVIDWNEMLKRAFTVNQFEPLFITIKLLTNFSLLELDGIYQKLLNVYENNDFKNGLSSHFVNSVSKLEIKDQYSLCNFSLASIIYKELREEIPIVKIYKNIRKIAREFPSKKVYFNQNLVEINNLSLLENSKFYHEIENATTSLTINWNEENIYIRLKVKDGSGIFYSSFESFVISFAKDEGLSFFDELKESEVKNKMFHQCTKTFIVKRDKINNNVIAQVGSNDFVTFNKENIDIKNENNEFRFEIEISWDKVGVLPSLRRIVDFQFNIDFKNCSFDEIYLARISTDSCNKYKYSLYQPWPSGYSRIQLIG